MKMETYTCPLCEGSKFESPRALSMHLSKSMDDAHQLLNTLRKEVKCAPHELTDVYLQHKAKFESLIQPKPGDRYMSVPCPCKQTCHECYTEWKNDFFLPCQLARKTAYIEEYGLNPQRCYPKQAKEKSAKPNETVEAFAALNMPKPRKQNPDSAPSLVRFYYELIGGQCINFPKEAKQVKNLLTSKTLKLTPEDVRTVMRFMARKGYIDLRFLSNSVQEALLEQRFLEESEQPGKPAYLVKQFYQGFNQALNMQTFIRDVQRIVETINSSSYEETEQVIAYMHSIDCRVLNFIGSKRNEMKMTQQRSKQQEDIEGRMRANPAMYDQSELVYIRDNLIGGRTTLSKVPDSYKVAAMEAAKQIFKEKRFSNQYGYFEWAWQIGLELDLELYSIASGEELGETIYDKIIRTKQLKPEEAEKIIRRRDAFKAWVESQHVKFAQIDKNA